MNVEEFRMKFIKGFKQTQLGTDSLSRVAVNTHHRSGRGTVGSPYEDLRWIRLDLHEKIGSVVSINVMPYRLDLDRSSGNIHQLAQKLQLVACVQGNDGTTSIGGPGLEKLENGGLAMRPQYYFPRIDHSESRLNSLSLDECFDASEQLSVGFVSALEAFLKQLESLAVKK